jgi:hypothetical protein
MAQITKTLRDGSGNAMVGWTVQFRLASDHSIVCTTADSTITDLGNGSYISTNDPAAGTYEVYACASGGTPALIPGHDDFLHVALPLPVASGGTGSATAADARTALGLEAGATATLPLSLANGGTASTSASQARSTLSLVPGTHVQEYSARLATLLTGVAGLDAVNSDGFCIYDTSDDLFGMETVANARTRLGLGDLYAENSPLPLDKGGTAATSASAARTSLGLGTIATFDYTKTGQAGKAMVIGEDGPVVMPTLAASVTANSDNKGKFFILETASSFGLYMIVKTGAATYTGRAIFNYTW